MFETWLRETRHEATDIRRVVASAPGSETTSRYRRGHETQIVSCDVAKRIVWHTQSRLPQTIYLIEKNSDIDLDMKLLTRTT